MQIQKASKVNSRLRLTLCGPAGSGKTYSGLAIASALAKLFGGRVLVIDTEHGTACKYMDEFDFDTIALDKDQSAKAYREALAMGEAAGYKVILIDSLSHAWAGRGGALEMADKITERSASGNYWAAWRLVSPEHNKLVDALIASDAHLIATMRVKTEWTTEKDDKGKLRPVKIGLSPVMRDGMEYEFDVVGDLDMKHFLAVSKTRCKVLDGADMEKPGENLAVILHKWLTDGNVEVPAKQSPAGQSIQQDLDAKAAELKAAAPEPRPAVAHAVPAPKPAPAPSVVPVKVTVSPAPPVSTVASKDIANVLVEWQEQFGERNMLKTREKFIYPFSATSLKTLAPKDYPELLKLVAVEYETSNRPFPPALTAALKKAGLLP